MSNAALTPVTTWSEARRHLAFTDDLQPHHRQGSVGVTLCGTDGYDQAAMDSERARYG